MKMKLFSMAVLMLLSSLSFGFAGETKKAQQVQVHPAFLQNLFKKMLSILISLKKMVLTKHVCLSSLP